MLTEAATRAMCVASNIRLVSLLSRTHLTKKGYTQKAAGSWKWLVPPESLKSFRNPMMKIEFLESRKRTLLSVLTFLTIFDM